MFPLAVEVDLIFLVAFVILFIYLFIVKQNKNKKNKKQYWCFKKPKCKSFGSVFVF